MGESSARTPTIQLEFSRQRARNASAMKSKIFLGLLFFLFVDRATLAVEPNWLTPAEKAEGWRLLFDGKSLDGWRGFRTEAPGAGWHVADGVLMTSGNAGDLMTKGVHGDFELTFEWRVDESGDSGLIYRIGLGEAATYRTGPEYQILDNLKAEDNKRPNHLAGSLYDLGPALAKDVTKPVGQWNSGRIVIRGWRIEHWLNGEKLLEIDLNSPAGRAAIARSEFKDWAKFASFPRGFIALQDHGHVVGFRSIKLRDLSIGD